MLRDCLGEVQVLAILGVAMTGLLKGCGCDGDKLTTCAMTTAVASGAACAADDAPTLCPATGKLRDPMSFWAGVMAGLNKGGETCASVGVSATTC
ncbi:unnamed protein product [Durusdinium trenchii]